MAKCLRAGCEEDADQRNCRQRNGISESREVENAADKDHGRHPDGDGGGPVFWFKAKQLEEGASPILKT